MKRAKDLFNDIASVENCRQAILNAASEKKTHKNVARVLNDIDKYALKLSEMIKNDTWVPSEPGTKKMYDDHRHKWRSIKCPRFYPDQCMHWAVMLVVKPIFMKGMDAHSYGNVPDRGVHTAKKYCERIIRKDVENTKYALNMDIRHNFDTTPRWYVKELLRKKIKDERTLALIDKIIDTPYKDIDGNEIHDGFPIGFYTSPWFANLALEPLDHLIREKWGATYYIRYADDMFVFDADKEKLHQIRKNISEWLGEHSMKLKPNWQVFDVDKRPIDFLGFTITRKYTKLRDSNFLRLSRRIRKASKKPKMNAYDARCILSMTGNLKHIPSHNFHEIHVAPYTSYKKLKGVVRNDAKNSKRYLPEYGDYRTCWEFSDCMDCTKRHCEVVQALRDMGIE